MSTFLNLDDDLKNQIFRKLEEHSGVGVWYLDIKTQEVFWSEKIFDIHGVDINEGVPSLDEAINFYHPDSREEIQQAVNDAIEYQLPWDLELKLIPKNKEFIWINTIGSIYQKDGNVQKIYGTFQDITEERNLKQDLKDRIDQLEKMNKVLVDREVKMVELKKKLDANEAN